MLIRIENVALRRGRKPLLESCNFVIQKGDHIGLIGANGTGKTSFLGLLSGNLEVDSGEITRAKELSIAWMEQEVSMSEQSALDYVLDGDIRLRKLQTDLLDAERDADEKAIATVHEKLENAGAYDANSRAESILAGLGFSQTEFSSPFQTFSGGWRIRLALARVLFSPADLLLLDEPTNHLDLDATIWLEHWLRKYDGAILLISHDRHFLDKTVKQIARIENLELKIFRGNYSAYELQRSEELSQQQSLFEKQQRRKKQIEAFVTRFRAKATKARQAQSRLKELKRMGQIASAHVSSPFTFSINTEGKLSDPLLKITDAAVGYADKVILENIQCCIRPGDRIGILGPNGAGKTTLLKALAGEIGFKSGQILKGEHLKSAYFAQHQLEELDLDASPFTHLLREKRTATDQEIRNFLGSFNFQGERVDEQVRIFSGGEKARLALAIIAWKKPNLLFLDEPTNHLDIELRQSLAFALQDYQGALVLISHDRHLLASCVDEFWLVNDGQMVSYDGNLDEYQRALIQGTSSGKSDTNAKHSKRKRQEQAAIRQKLNPVRKKLTLLEADIKIIREELSNLEEILASPVIYQDDKKKELQENLMRQGQLQIEVEEKELAWFRIQEELDTLIKNMQDDAHDE